VLRSTQSCPPPGRRTAANLLCSSGGKRLNCSTEIAPACDGAGAVAGGVNGAGAGGGVGLPVAHSRRRGTSGCSTGTSCRSTAAGVTWGWASKASAPETVGGTASLSGAIQQRTPHTGRALTDHPEDAFLRAADPRPGRQRNCDPPGTANLSRHAKPSVRGSARQPCHCWHRPARAAARQPEPAGPVAEWQHLQSAPVAFSWLERRSISSSARGHLPGRRTSRTSL
jgi:hypothetical protein